MATCNTSNLDLLALAREGCSPTYNLSEIKYTKPADIPTWEIALKIIVYVVIIIVAFFGNIAVICVVVFNKHMKSTTNIYIANLAVADFLMSCCPMWVQMVEGVTHTWYLGAAICKMYPFIQVTTMCCSIFTMTAIACDRFFAVVFPLKSRSTPRNVAVIISIIWAMSIALGVPAFLAYQYRERQWKDHFEQFCNEDFSWMLCDVQTLCEYTRLRQLYRKAYWTFVCAVANWLPMVTMHIGYLTIAIIMYRRNRIVPNSSSGNNGQASVQQRSLKKVLRMLFILLVVFMVCWVPFQVQYVYSVYRTDNGSQVMPWFVSFQFGSILMANCNSAMNPIIYAGLNENFRKGFVHLFCCWRRRYFNDGSIYYSFSLGAQRISHARQ
ncbi:substance-P receptor-like isoform X2 [Tubulanus polymorphus]|uniref:substance-P receptor-like isoform X2 n=1 Tax=Tubulanus polymorphus TaxID=672921 RepID=UPI003DA4229A